jgi:predicted deacylase
VTGSAPESCQGPLRLGKIEIARGRRRKVELPVARLPTDTWLSLPVMAVNGLHPGPRLWLCAALHGDELNGVEIIRQVMERVDPREISGAVIAAPIVNVFGFISGSRYLPDRRDLNRSFPGSARGSLASRLAHLFMTEVVSPCGYGIDFHTGSDHRTNLPQVRLDLRDEETRRVARAFGAPVLIHARSRDGSLREAATSRGCHVLLFEAGEPHRFNPEAIRAGVEGTLRVLDCLGIRRDPDLSPAPGSLEVGRTRWVRARRSGILRLRVATGERVREGQELGVIGDAFGDKKATVRAPFDGLVLGQTRKPLVTQGDGLLNLADLSAGGSPLQD